MPFGIGGDVRIENGVEPLDLIGHHALDQGLFVGEVMEQAALRKARRIRYRLDGDSGKALFVGQPRRCIQQGAAHGLGLLFAAGGARGGQCDAAVENKRMTTTPLTIKAMPIMAAPSRG